MEKTYLILIYLLASQLVSAQILRESNLPIIVIDTNEEEIPDEPKIVGTIGIINKEDGQLNRLSDPFDYYSGQIGIETRGNSTQGFEKVSYSVELRTAADQDTSVNLFDMGKEEDWILHAMFIDKTQLRIPYSFYLFQQMGHYASEWQYVELVINGDYRGLYLFCEKIKRDDDRVDIAKLGREDVSGDAVTGGYILRIDWLDNYEGFESAFPSQGSDAMTYQWYYPKANNIGAAQAEYIEDWMYRFESAVFADDYKNDQGERYTDLIDVTSFTDFLLINELSKNADGYKLSSFIHKDADSRGGKLAAGPIWDFDQTYGSSLVCSNHLPFGWTFLQNQEGCEDLESMPMWWQRMMEDTIFTNHLACRWETFRQSFLDEDAINDWIVNDTTLISAAIDRNYQRWDEVIGEYIWIEPEPLPQTYAEEIEVMQSWIARRLIWLDANMPGNCAFDIISNVEEERELVDALYPNPTSTQVNVRSREKVNICLLDMLGRIQYCSPVARFSHEVDINGLPPGQYLMMINNQDRSTVKRLLIQ